MWQKHNTMIITDYNDHLDDSESSTICTVEDSWPRKERMQRADSSDDLSGIFPFSFRETATQTADEESSSTTSSTTLSRTTTVQFNERQNEYFDDTVRSAEDCREQWYTKKDFRGFRRYTKKLVARAQSETTEDFSKVLTEVFDLVLDVNYVLRDARDLLTPSLTRKLKTLYHDRRNLTGLEYHVCEAIQETIEQKRQDMQEAVQEILVEQKQGLWESREEMEKEMRDSCLNFSQSAGLFAQLLAQAQKY